MRKGLWAGKRISELNEGLRTFEEELRQDLLASRRVEVGIVTFGDGGVNKIQDFVTAAQFTAPSLSAGGNTPMGRAIDIALDMVRERKAEYKRSGVGYYQPWIFLITDGAPADSWQEAARRSQQEMEATTLTLFAVGVAGADMEVLNQLTPRTLKLDGLRFRELFIWLSQSQKRVSGSRPGDQTALPPVNFAAPITS